MENFDDREGVVLPAADADGDGVVYPERDLQPGDPRMAGGAAAEEKKGIAGRVKDMVGRCGRRKHGAHGRDKTAPTGDTEVTGKGGVLQKVKTKAGRKVGHGQDNSKHGPARLLSMSSSSSSMSSSDEEDIGTVGFAMDPTGPAVAGTSLGREDFSNAPQFAGADFRDLNVNSDGKEAERAAQFAKSSNPVNFSEAQNSSALTGPPEESNHGGSARSLTSETSTNSDLPPSNVDSSSNGPDDHSLPTDLKSNDQSNQTAREHLDHLHGGSSAKQGASTVHKILNSVH